MSLKLMYNPNCEKQMLVEFANGALKPASKLACKVYRSKNQNDPKSKDRKLLLVDGKHMNYFGDNYRIKESHPYARKKLVVKINRKTGEAQIFDTDHFLLRPVKKANALEEEADTNNEVMKTYFEKNRALVGQFGTSKQKRKILANQRSGGANASEAVQNSVVEMIKNTTITSEEALLPAVIIPCKADADTVEEVYPLENLVPTEVCECLLSEAEQFIEPTPETLAGWKEQDSPMSCDFILEHAKHPSAACLEDPNVYTDYACCLQLMYYIIRAYLFKDMDSKTRAKSLRLLGTSSFTKWMTGFFLHRKNAGLIMSPKMKDKILAIGIVLAWHMDSFQTKAESLRAAFRISKLKLSCMVRALGGTIKTSTRDGIKCDYYVLSLPLKFAQTAGRRKRN